MRNQRPAKYFPGNLQSHGKCCPLEAAGWAEVCKLFVQIWARLPVKPGLIYHFKSKPVGISSDCRWDPVASQGFRSLSWGNQTLCDTMLEIFFHGLLQIDTGTVYARTRFWSGWRANFTRAMLCDNGLDVTPCCGISAPKLVWYPGLGLYPRMVQSAKGLYSWYNPK